MALHEYESDFARSFYIGVKKSFIDVEKRLCNIRFKNERQTLIDKVMLIRKTKRNI